MKKVQFETISELAYLASWRQQAKALLAGCLETYFWLLLLRFLFKHLQLFTYSMYYFFPFLNNDKLPHEKVNIWVCAQEIFSLPDR